jgi:hypothetical protein
MMDYIQTGDNNLKIKFFSNLKKNFYADMEKTLNGEKVLKFRISRLQIEHHTKNFISSLLSWIGLIKPKTVPFKKYTEFKLSPSPTFQFSLLYSVCFCFSSVQRIA